MSSANDPLTTPQHVLIHDARALSSLLSWIASEMEARNRYRFPFLWKRLGSTDATQLRGAAMKLRKLANDPPPSRVIMDEILDSFDLAERTLLAMYPEYGGPDLARILLRDVREKHAELRSHWFAKRTDEPARADSEDAIAASDEATGSALSYQGQ